MLNEVCDRGRPFSLLRLRYQLLHWPAARTSNGFVDLSQIVFTMEAGALFGYELLWTVLFGTAAIIVYMEMCGRVGSLQSVPIFQSGLGKEPTGEIRTHITGYADRMVGVALLIAVLGRGL